MLNALFGNPNIHLVQLHPDFKQGINTYKKARDNFSSNFTDSYCHENEKKRKNAVTEVVRFICKQEFKVEASGDIYIQALSYLLNGDIKAAVNLLNYNKKTQMATYVLNCFGSELQKAALL
jgi:hypothetical protein